METINLDEIGEVLAPGSVASLGENFGGVRDVESGTFTVFYLSQSHEAIFIRCEKTEKILKIPFVALHELAIWRGIDERS